MKTVIYNIGTLAGILPADVRKLEGSQMNTVECIENAYLVIEDGVITEFGPTVISFANAQATSSITSEVEKSLTPALIRKVIIKIRKEKLPEPSVMGSAGSFFKNPVISAEHFARIEAAAKAELGADCKVPHYDLPDGTVKVPAAWMIEQCGWKGKRSGNAAVYDKQPLVIVNYTGEAYPEEIIGLEKRIIASVKTKFDIELHPEVDHI